MSDLQLYIAIGLPTVAVLASMTVSLIQISAIREDIREIRNRLEVITSKLADLDTRVSLIEERSR